MNFIYGLITGIIISTISCLIWLKTSGYKKSAKETPSKKVDSAEQVDLPEYYEEKAKNMAKLKDYIKTKDRFTNDELQSYLKVSDTTIGRYLDELEKEKVIKQVGKTGRSVYYAKT